MIPIEEAIQVIERIKEQYPEGKNKEACDAAVFALKYRISQRPRILFKKQIKKQKEERRYSFVAAVCPECGQPVQHGCCSACGASAGLDWSGLINEN